MTNIDRKKCSRVVPMKFLCLGQPRTGTSSIYQAFEDLGHRKNYDYGSVYVGNPRDAEMWTEALEAKYEGKGPPFGRKEWDQLLGHVTMVSDAPCTAFYRELLEAYPEAKVILSVRDSPEQWYRSQMNTAVPSFARMYGPDASIGRRLFRLLSGPESAVERMNELLWRHYFSTDIATGGTKFYQDFLAEVQRLVPKERLLVYNVRQGWEPLCAFLGAEIPAHPFPRANDAQTFQARDMQMHRRKSVDMTSVLIAAGVVGGLVLGLSIF